MCDYDLVYSAIEDFLADERDKLLDDRSVLNIVLQTLQDFKQVDHNQKEGKSFQIDIKYNSDCEESTTIDSVKVETEISCIEKKNDLKNDQTYSAKDSGKLKYYNSQLEKERLTYLFENAPNFLYLNCNSRKSKYNENRFSSRCEKESCNEYDENKENYVSKYHVSRRQTHFLPTVENIQNDSVKTMVRYGEFSPLNPNLRLPSSTGFGEYEERRKIFLERKKREYQQYLARAKNRKDLMFDQKNKNPPILIVHNNDSSGSRPSSATSQSSTRSYWESFIPNQRMVENSDTCFFKYQQETYRKELDTQTEEEKTLLKKPEVSKRENCEKLENNTMTHRKSVMKYLEDEFHHKIDLLKGHSNGNSNNTKEQSDLLPNTDGVNHSSNQELQKYKLSVQRPSVIRNRTMKLNAESCSIDDVKVVEKMKQELYKEELTRQIEEKRRFEELRKAKEEEEEKKLEEKIKREEEKLRQDYEKEQAKIAHRASQRVQIQERVLENLRRIQKEKSAFEEKLFLKENTKPTNIFHAVRGATRNVSFAPHASIYSIHSQIPNDVPEKVHHCQENSVIIEAPYLLAVKDVPVCSDTTNQLHFKHTHALERSPSPILPALRTQNLLKSLSKSEKPYIPSAVSLSEYAKETYLKSNEIFSSFAQIRKQLLEKRSDFHPE